MRLFRARFGAVIGAAALVAVFAAPAGAATTAQRASTGVNSGSGCNPDPFAAVTECTQVIGAGLEVDSISGGGYSNVDYTITEVHIEIYGPNGHIHNCSQFNLAPFGSMPICRWTNPNPETNVRAGDYCSRSWQQVTPGYYIVLSAECINVHA
jgi:hypothetical protein